ncbi:N-acetylneuraminate synthase family protein [Deltaproteobacteria bacterium TL4]
MKRYPNWPLWPHNRTALIAEVGINHGGDEVLAWKMIESAHNAGADFVKLQSFITADFFHPSLSNFQSTQALELSWDAQKRLFSKASSAGITLISTPYDQTSADLLDELEVAAFKIASMDNDNYPFIEYVAKKGRPLIISTGMADLGEIQKLIETVSNTGNEQLVLLHCISDYPTRLEDMHLANLEGLDQTFNVPVGLSDHSLGLEAPFVAASLGVAVIEKHFTTDKTLQDRFPDSDNEISILPSELQALSVFCNNIAKIKGVFPRPLTENEIVGRKEFRRGLYAKRDIAEGEVLSLDNVIFLRPVQGISAGNWDHVCGQNAKTKIPKLSPIHFSHIEYFE